MIDQIARFKLDSLHNFTTSKSLATQFDTSISTYSMTYMGLLTHPTYSLIQGLLRSIVFPLSTPFIETNA